MKTILAIAMITLTSSAYAAETNYSHPCERSHWLAFFGFDPNDGMYCGGPALGDPDHTFSVADHANTPPVHEPPPDHCPYGD
jgi:hypothetical protein